MTMVDTAERQHPAEALEDNDAEVSDKKKKYSEKGTRR
jgi:hypothetical protein